MRSLLVVAVGGAISSLATGLVRGFVGLAVARVAPVLLAALEFDDADLGSPALLHDLGGYRGPGHQRGAHGYFVAVGDHQDPIEGDVGRVGRGSGDSLAGALAVSCSGRKPARTSWRIVAR